MRVTALVEDAPVPGYASVHGLSFYIETKRHKILFDVGPDETLFLNAKKKQIDLGTVDTVVISHGHNDHGGALSLFLEQNKKAIVYVQKKAFLPHYSLREGNKRWIGLDAALASHPQIVLLEGDYTIDEELALFTVSTEDLCHSPANDNLFSLNARDDFSHEQHLMILEGAAHLLLMGCGHKGILTILEKGKLFLPTAVIGGFHLENKEVKASQKLLEALIAELKVYKGISFYTCHCTGKEAFSVLSSAYSNFQSCSLQDWLSF